MTGLLDYFRSTPRNSASLAKERLQIIVAHERGVRQRGPDYLPKLQQELLAVVRKYVHVEDTDIRVSMENEDGCEVLELNISLPENNA
ncbi:cell division topological specificity factor MinE [Candidatus Venteria ishoeyi]|uniref:Cell division topological specificity factor n=1 Tax=Candidatus Venteria ishoeyi TaxID=1899563 RepID=A0A1H6F2Y2_9GAMM|nr:cell division topological specificity factor MinE [Candidatus Venteria ishoeyi]MDM8547778.1 cell division topological specificity factor MinE [Candidatus Venteria ishoeyi]SEH04480.1 Cell division topological specificity factor [Candidatus Venteria ishoeyi]